MPHDSLGSTWLDLVEGRRNGVAGRCARAGLAALSLPYAAGIALRSLAYRIGMLRTHRLPVPVVSVGNLSLGGTGKTPMVALLSRRLVERGHRVAVLTRGYGRTAAGDDEDLLPESVPRVVDPVRVRGGRRAVEELAATCLVLDDGFQHRALARDLDVVLLDATRPLADARLFPAGLLREPLSALRRAGVVVLTRTDQATPERLAAARAAVARVTGRAPAEAVHRPAGVRNWPEAGLESLAHVAGTRVFGFCALGNPEAFRRSLEGCGAHVVGFHAFPDHHPFTEKDRTEVSREAESTGADWFLTTAKDALRLDEGWRHAARPIRILEVEMELTQGGEALWSALETVCPAPSPAGKAAP